MIISTLTTATSRSYDLFVTVGEAPSGRLMLIEHSTGIGSPEYAYLFKTAAAKLGWRRDRRCREGWRKVSARVTHLSEVAP